MRATVREVNRLTPNIVEVVVEAPQAALNFVPGQFYRLQNYEALAGRGRHGPDDGRVGPDRRLGGQGSGLVSIIVLEMGGSSDLCAVLKPMSRSILMGPTGTPTEIPRNETVLLAGGGLGNAVLFSIGRSSAPRVRVHVLRGI